MTCSLSPALPHVSILISSYWLIWVALVALGAPLTPFWTFLRTGWKSQEIGVTSEEHRVCRGPFSPAWRRTVHPWCFTREGTRVKGVQHFLGGFSCCLSAFRISPSFPWCPCLCWELVSVIYKCAFRALPQGRGTISLTVDPLSLSCSLDFWPWTHCPTPS